jgi:hypothetical protein
MPHTERYNNIHLETPPSSGEEDIWETFTFLNDDDFTDDTDVINNMPRDVIDGDLVSSLASRGQKHHTRRRGERVSQQAHQDYLAHIYADRNPNDYNGSKQALKKNLEFGRRWSILIDGYTVEDNNVVPGLGLGILLLCGPSIKTKM